MASSAKEQSDQLIGGRTVDEVRAALAQAVPNALRLALYQATGDAALLAMKVQKDPYWGGAFDVAGISEDDAKIVREKALAFLTSGGSDRPGASLSLPELRPLMANFLGDPEVADYVYEMAGGDLIDDPFPLGVEWSAEPSAAAKQAFHTLIIGAGVAGLTTAIQLDRLGLPYTLVERNAGVGGTWWINDYPEARVDIASHHYQLSFMKNHAWKNHFAPRDELLDYLQEVADKYNLQRKIRFNTTLTEACWDEAASLWRVKVTNADGGEETISANVVISGAGLFNMPNLPNIPGIETFKGEMFHTTAWNHDYDYRGKRVAQIGAGSTGAQMSSAIGEAAGQYTIYLRSPQWVSAIENYREPISAEMQWLLDNMPHYWGWYSYCLSAITLSDPTGLQDRDPEWCANGGQISRRNDSLRKHNTEYLMSKIGHRPDLVEKTLPKFPPFAKRPVVDNGWFDTLNRDNVDLISTPIERITETGIRTVDGDEREFDLLLLCAGFDTQRYLWPVRYEGRDGITLEKAWEKDGARSYLGETVPGFPNLFIIYGPNGQARAGGLIKWIEIWSRYAVRSIVKMVEGGIRSMEVKQQVHDDYNARLDDEMKRCIWDIEGQKSYYTNDFGRSSVNMPWRPAEYFTWIRDPNLDDYDLKR